ncbi:FISUMP domain-containing protein [Fibrobacter sp. UBA4297]|uniref:FISUMP domain-containing protein n=1 Tax=Fibrobacter sp. UBA4297 TaxID=1946536 RepID=UPI0025BEBDF7|nr:FISUMP domain-containing protein [Fibrobacter sp. UBA4297]
MKKCLFRLWPVFALAACGDDITTENITQVTQPGMEIVADLDALPDCGSENKGAQAWVKSESTTFVCTGDEWFRAKSTAGSYSCKTQALSDSSGIKIVCNGDSVGVLLNGENGKKGENGQNASQMCSATQIKNTTFVKVVCKNDSLIFDMDKDSGKSSSSSVKVSSSSKVVVSSSSLDEEAVQTSLDSMSGFSQKGPFVQGSNVRLYELTDGRTLKQTNGNFMGVINSNDGFFRISARNLVSQYALLVANGYYKNEVTGRTTSDDLTLFALTDVSKRSRANVNLLTHLEYDRVFYLVTKEKMKVKAAKHKAQSEILKAFHIDTTGVGESEDLSVFGTNKGNAALLAISVMLQSTRSIAELTDILSAISADLEKDGILDESLTIKIADGAVKILPFLQRIRANVKGWNLGDVPEFESIIKNFVSVEYGVDACTASNEGKVIQLLNAKSELDKFYLGCENGIWRVKMDDPKTGLYYNVAFIGKQIWMAEDLAVENADNPGLLKYEIRGRDILDSISLEKGGTQGICPDGWHIPSFKEWEDQLMEVWTETTYEEAINNLWYNGSYGTHGLSVPDWVDARLKATEGWLGSGNGTDDYGFAAKPLYTHYDEEPGEYDYRITYFSSTMYYDDENDVIIRCRIFHNQWTSMSLPYCNLDEFYAVRCKKN